MTDLAELAERHPLPWTGDTTALYDARGRPVHVTEDELMAIALGWSSNAGIIRRLSVAARHTSDESAPVGSVGDLIERVRADAAMADGLRASVKAILTSEIRS